MTARNSQLLTDQSPPFLLEKLNFDPEHESRQMQ